MSRVLLVLLSAMMLSAAFSGCFSSEDDKKGDSGKPATGTGGGNNTTAPPTNNTTAPPKIVMAPTPAFTVNFATFDSDGGELTNTTGLNATVKPETWGAWTFDGTPSNDSDGTIEAYSWQVITPDGKEHKNAGPLLWFKEEKLKAAQFGAYKATLKVLDNDNVLNAATFYFILDYTNTFGLPNGMTGPGQATCDAEQAETPGGGDVNGVAPGTYGIHTVTLAANATSLDLVLTYAATATTTMTMRVLPPGSGDHDCSAAIGTGAGGSPVSVSIAEADLTGAGSYVVRVDTAGIGVESYSIDALVKYKAPIQSTGDDPPAEEETTA